MANFLSTSINSKKLLTFNMKTMSIIEFWKSLDTAGKDRLRILVSKDTDCALSTVDKYGTGAVNPSVKKKVKIRRIAEKHFNVTLNF